MDAPVSREHHLLMDVPLRISVLRPMRGVRLALQRGRDELLPPSRETSDSLSFDFVLRVATPGSSKQPRWLGACAQGKPDDRFVYINAGQRAGQTGTAWDRRAKVKLASITLAQIQEVLGKPGLVLEAAFEGCGPDGGPACATVPLIGSAWRVVDSGD
jgi:hypothetical protein